MTMPATAVQVRVKQVKTKHLQRRTMVDGKIAGLGLVVTTPPFLLHLPPSYHPLLPYQHLQSPTTAVNILSPRKLQHGLAPQL